VVGGEVGYLVWVTPAVTHRGVHVKIGQHAHSLPGIFRHPATA
jgi:hypothetical protein